MIETECTCSAFMAGEPRAEEAAQLAERRARLLVFLTELTALSQKHGFYIEARTEAGYSGGDYGVVELEDGSCYGEAASYGVDHNGHFMYRPWKEQFWADGNSVWAAYED